MPELGKLTRIDPRTVWPHEAADFTPWLAEHLESLSEVLGLDLELVDRESPVGDFSADILAKDLGTGRVVVIENQLGPTDHGHLGQTITYAAGLDAQVIIWISRDFREEHRQALDWLNRGHGTTTDFFGVVVEVLQIEESKPAVSFRPVAFPNDWSRRHRPRSRDGELTSKQERYRQFFQLLIDELRDNHRFTNARAGQPQNWYSFSSGHRGFLYSVSFATGGRLRTEIYVDTGDGERNQTALESLRSQTKDIESEFGERLEWEALEGKRACRIALYRDASIEDSDEKLEEYRAWAVAQMLAFKRVFDTRLNALSIKL